MKRYKIPYFSDCKKTVFIHNSYSFSAKFENFDINDSWHVILWQYLLRLSRDNCQNNRYKARKRFLFRLWLKSCSNSWFRFCWQFCHSSVNVERCLRSRDRWHPLDKCLNCHLTTVKKLEIPQLVNCVKTVNWNSSFSLGGHIWSLSGNFCFAGRF